MESTIYIREATLGDNEALLKLQLRCPQGTDLVFQFDRSPDFFARSMPYKKLWNFVAEERGQIVGSIECALREVYIGGAKCKAMYVFGIMVDPMHRRKGIASMLQSEVDELATRVDADLMYVLIVEENVPSLRLTEKRGFRLWKNIRENMTIAFRKEENISPSDVRTLGLEDVPEAVTLINGHHEGQDFWLPFTVKSFLEYVERMPHFELENILVFGRGGEISAVLGFWEHYKLSAPRVVKYSFKMRMQLFMLKVLKLFTEVPKIPDLGDKSLQIILVPVAYSNLEACRELLKHVKNLAIKKNAHFITLVCEEDGSLEELMERNRDTVVNIHQMVKPLKNQKYESPSSRRLYINPEDI